MVVATDVTPAADVVFVIEGTANLGAYLDQADGLKTNYIVPTLEYFNGGSSDDNEAGLDCNGTMYALVVFMAADCAPEPAVSCYAQTTSVNRVLSWLDQIPFVGGAGEGHSHIAEGLSTSLQVFDDFQAQREPSVTTQKHCILICNSPPYPLACVESQNYIGYMADQLATLMGERGINLTVISPRKIPALLKLYDKAGGDLQVMQTKNYAKDRRHLILLRGFQLQERPVSPSTLEPKAKPQPPPETKPPITADSPAMGANTHSVPSPQQPGAKKRPAGGSPPNQPPFKQHVGMMGPQSSASNVQSGQQPQQQPQQNQPQQAPQSMISMHPPSQRTMMSNMAPQVIGRQGSFNSAPSSTSFLNQPNPPNVTINTKGPLPGMDGGGMGIPRPNQVQSPMGIRNSWPQGIAQPPQGMSHLLNQLKGPIANSGNAQMNMNRPMAPNMVPNQTIGQHSNAPQSGPGVQHNQPSTLQTQLSMANSMNTLPQSQANFSAPMTISSQQSQTSAGPMTAMGGQAINAMGNQVLGQQAIGNPLQGSAQKERRSIWSGTLEWQEKAKALNDSSSKVTRAVPCQVLSYLCPTGETEVNADKWPKKLIMQLIPKQLVSSFGGLYLKNSRNVVFQFTSTNEALETLNKVMSNGFAGCVHFSNSQCDIRVMILLYAPEKRAYIGFIPTDQTGLVSAIRMAITSHKNKQVVKQQQQIIQQGAPNQGLPQQSSPAPQGQAPNAAIYTSAASTAPQQMQSMNAGINTSSAPSGNQPGASTGGVFIAQSNQGASGGTATINMNGGQAAGPPLSQLEAERVQNLLKIQQLQQTLEAAQQKELQFKTAQEQQQKAVRIQHQHQQIMHAQPGAATNNPQLRHLLQQQQQAQQQAQQLRHQMMLQHRAQISASGQMNPGNMPGNMMSQSQSMQNSGTGLFPDDGSFLDIP